MHQPRISIVTINYNNADGLATTLQSVATQDYGHLEHVLYDGMSTDHSKEVIVFHGKHLAKCRVAANGGIYFNQNRGFELSTGEYVLFLNSGDYLHNPGAVSSLVAAMHPATDIGYGNLWLKDGSQITLKTYPSLLPPEYFLYETLAHPATLIRRTLLERFGMYDETLRICSDWKFFLQASCASNVRFQHLNEAPSVFGLDGTSSKPQNRPTILSEKLSTIQSLFPEMEEDFRRRNNLSSAFPQDKRPGSSLADRVLTLLKKSLAGKHA